MTARDDGTKPSRRKVIRGGVIVAGGALAAAAHATAAAANTGDPLVLGTSNVASSPTQLVNLAAGPAFSAIGTNGAGVIGTAGQGLDPNDVSVTAAGVFGLGGTQPGVFGQSLVTAGVTGTSGQVQDPNEVSVTAAGVFGFADTRPGVFGQSLSTAGVIGTVGQVLDPNDVNGIAAGVFGFASQPGIAGIRGSHALASEVALEVAGRLVLSTAGTVVIPPNTRRLEVQHPAVNVQSAILATANSFNGRSIQAVLAQQGSFVIQLTAKSAEPTTVAYAIIG